MWRKRNNQRGQMVVMASMVLFAMVGVLGLAVDLGWAYYLKKSAQASADAAALGAVRYAYANIVDEEEGGPVYVCGPDLVCQAATPCPNTLPSSPGNNIEAGCLYAARNGFQVGGDGGRQNVTFAADVTSPPPTAPGVNVYYWATARVSEQVPQLFSAILGNTVGMTSARATAAIVDSTILGSLILLNREGDCVRMDTSQQLICGVDLMVQANDNMGLDAVRADGGVLMASTLHGEDDHWSGENQGGGTVRAPYTYIRGAGDVVTAGSSQWIQDPDNGYADRWYFKDPMRGKGQPPPPTALIDRPIMGGTILGSDDPNNPATYYPGNYYAAGLDRQGNVVATGDPLVVTGYARFCSDASCTGGGFGNYVFYGGVANKSAGTEVTFDPGRYVFAGAKQSQGHPTPLFDVQRNMIVHDLTSIYGRNTDPGEIFIFTDASYPGLEVPAAVQPIQGQLVHGISGFQTGNAASIEINIHGLNREHAAIPAELKDFAPVILWQDQRNSVIKYTPDGYIDTSCGATVSVGCPNDALLDDRSVEMFFQASPSLHIYGTAYQPRGAFTTMTGGGGYSSPLQLIAGALRVHGNSNVRLQEIYNPLLVKVVSLVE